MKIIILLIMCQTSSAAVTKKESEPNSKCSQINGIHFCILVK